MGFYVLATITLYSTGLNNMNIRIVSLCFALGLVGCNSNPVVSDIASATLAATGTAAKPVPVVTTPTSVTIPHISNSSSAHSGSTHKVASDSSFHQYRCADLTDSQAQVLMEAGHRYLDADGDGDACEPDPRRDYAPVAAKSSDGNCHWVDGYIRKNGTKVRGHKRCR